MKISEKSNIDLLKWISSFGKMIRFFADELDLRDSYIGYLDSMAQLELVSMEFYQFNNPLYMKEDVESADLSRRLAHNALTSTISAILRNSGIKIKLDRYEISSLVEKSLSLV